MMRSRFRFAYAGARIALVVVAVAAVLQPAVATAQTQQQIEQQLRALGLQNVDPSQIRQRLQQMGYDPSILDSYLQGAQSGQPGQLSPEAMAALQALTGPVAPDTVTRAAEAEQEEDDASSAASLLPDSSAMEVTTGLRVFGLETFARRSREFDAMGSGPVPPGYLLGPGDEIVLILTGDVEQQLLLPVTRDGFIVIPQAGKVWVNGLTMAELRERLYTVLGRVYSGIGRGPEATTHFEASLGRLRSNQVYITGQVRRPGAFTTGALASVLNALYKAGGPLPTGSFRDVRVMRNDELVARVDLYAYLTQGRNISDLVLQPGDVIFVPPVGPQVAVRGAVTREALYEIVEGETVLDAIEFAAGLSAPAALGQARITRILPPSQRTEPGVGRTVVNVDLAEVVTGRAAPEPLYDGDELRIFRVRPELRKVVTISGAVWKDCQVTDRLRTEPEPEVEVERPDSVLVMPDSASNGTPPRPRMVAAPRAPEARCTFHYTPGMRAWDAIEAAEGLRPDAYRQRAQIVRMNPADSTLSSLRFSLERAADGTPLENPELREFDAIRVFSRTHFQDSLFVRLSGEVRRPGRGTFQYREGMTLEDLLLQAGGLTPEADLVIEVSRRPGPAERQQGRITETVQIPVDPAYIISEEGMQFYPGEVIDDNGDGISAASFSLRPHDQVFVRRVPNLSEGERTVRIAGEVTYPGVYALRSKDERLSQLVDRAGGLTNTAFADGFRLYRNGKLVNIDLPEVMQEPGSEADLILLPGDSMVLPEYDPVVVVEGAVNSPAAVLYKEGAGLDYYIANAGGYARNADREHVNVRFANGEGAVREQVLFYTRSPKPGPGSVVNVPTIPESERGDLLQTLSRFAQVTGTILTTLLLLQRL